MNKKMKCCICDNNLVHLNNNDPKHVLRINVCSLSCFLDFLSAHNNLLPLKRKSNYTTLVKYNTKKNTFKSNLEKITAQKLQSCNINYEYEPYLALSNIHNVKYSKYKSYQSCYLPDFYLPEYGIFLEAKGVLRSKDYKKIIIFSQSYPIYIVMDVDLNYLFYKK